MRTASTNNTKVVTSVLPSGITPKAVSGVIHDSPTVKSVNAALAPR